MTFPRKNSRSTVSAMIFAGAAALSVWMGAAYVAATAAPTAVAPAFTSLARN